METLYVHLEEIHNTRAAAKIVPIIRSMVPVKSVLDVGCGTGTWLNVFQQHGADDILGMDGNYVDRTKLQIDDKYFKEYDLRKSFNLNRTFDLSLCLEVAEHLPNSSAEDLVQSLCRHSNYIIFSAAIPGQGGQNHINEQWTDFWKEKFKNHGFTRLDLIRPKIWSDQSIDIWYRQNIFLFVKNAEEFNDARQPSLIVEIHPEFWKMKTNELDNLKRELYAFDNGQAGVKRSFNAFVKALRNKITIS